MNHAFFCSGGQRSDFYENNENAFKITDTNHILIPGVNGEPFHVNMIDLIECLL